MNLESGFRYIDIHSHLNFAAFDADRDETVKHALDAEVALINVGTQKDTSKKAVEIAEKYGNGVYAIVGVHPIHTSKSFHDEEELGKIGSHPLGTSPSQEGEGFVSRGEAFDISYYKVLAEHPKVVAIGECGLDYYRMEHEGWNMEQKKQEETFRKQIELANEVGKPLMLHLRNGCGRSAYDDAFSILNSYSGIHTSAPRGNLHFFAGSPEEAKPFLDAGYTFSFTGVITFTHDYDEVIRYLPLDAILSETDSPYVAPVPYRGKRNEPLYVKEVVKAIARIRGENEEKVRAAIMENARAFFRL